MHQQATGPWVDVFGHLTPLTSLTPMSCIRGHTRPVASDAVAVSLPGASSSLWSLGISPLQEDIGGLDTVTVSCGWSPASGGSGLASCG